MRFCIAVLCLLAVVASADVISTRSTSPDKWLKGDRAHSEATVSFTLGIQQKNIEVLEQIFEEVSNPQHANYQNFLTREEVLNIIAPSVETVRFIETWLVMSGVEASAIKSMGDALDVSTTVAIAEELFSTTFHTFTHTESGKTVVRQWGSYSLPREILNHVELVSGIANFPVPHYYRKHASNDDQTVIPQSLSTIYDLPTLVLSSSNTSQGVIEFQGQCFSPAELLSFSSDVEIKIPTVSAAHIVGTNDASSPGVEATLDIQWIMAMNPSAENDWFWIEDGNGWLYQFGTHFFNTTDIPNVISISYGWSEIDQCEIAPTECSSMGVTDIVYIRRVNIEFLKIGARGVSILVASGDSGANGRTDGGCTLKYLKPDFPGASPYVTAVGATQLNDPVYSLSSPPAICKPKGSLLCVSGGTEVAVSYAVAGFASGGGFSRVASSRSYQTTAIATYLASGVELPPSTYYNATGRGYPDVAAVGHNTLIYTSGSLEPVGGTSASTPIFAGIVTLLNDASIAKSGKPLGFLNYFLYQMAAAAPTAFHDITSGDNKCTEDGCASSCKGFLATTGWDPVTGLGSPNYPAMLAYLNSL